MGRQAGADDGTGSAPDPSSSAARDPRLAVFAWGGGEDGAAPSGPLPSGRLALLADELSGPERRCPGATDAELVGLVRAWAAIESWGAAAKLGAIREMIRRDGVPSPGADHGDLPETWSPSLRYELAQALSCSTQSAETTAWLAWEQAARLPWTGALLEDGTLTPAKARAIVETFRDLMDLDAAKAEAIIADQLAGKTYTQVLRLAEQAALTVDPGLAERRRERAVKNDARVTFFREQAGTAGLSGRDLPPDEALAAMAIVNARADEYRDSEAFEDTPMDVLRAYAYLDLINNVPAHERIAGTGGQDDIGADVQAVGDPGQNGRGQHDHGQDGRDHDDPDPDDPDPDGPGPDGPGPHGSGPDGSGSDGSESGGPGSGGRRPADLIVPLATLLGLAERPGEIQGFGLLDPGLAREFAAAAVASPGTEICVTVTSPEGYAVGHGCGKPHRPSGPIRGPDSGRARFPARLNLTIPATALTGGQGGRVGPSDQWAFKPRGGQTVSSGAGLPGAGPPGACLPEAATRADGWGAWTLTLPDGRLLGVRLEPVPVFDCDHRYETRGYRPSDLLRHLVQVRDGTCTFPSCNRHARESDFDHALPYDQGGKTCACNAGARSRACHRVKQSPGWNVTQPKPGWHQWVTPAGWVYVQEPKRYPA